MGAWIEIKHIIINIKQKASHPTMGAWIEIVSEQLEMTINGGRTPRWVRGLKFLCLRSSS